MCVYTDRDRSTKIFCEFSPPPRKSRSAGGFSNRRVPTPTPTRDPAVCATKIGFVSPGNTATGAAATGSRVSQSSSSDVGRSAEPSGRVKRGRADVESSFSLSLCVSLWLSDPLSLSLVALDPAPTKKRALATESNQINQSARRRRRRRGRVEESSRRREARGRVPDDRGARRGRRRRRIETKDTAV